MRDTLACSVPAAREAPGLATLGQVSQARSALLRVGMRAMDARGELGAYLRGDRAALGRALELLDAIEQDLDRARGVIRSRTDETEPWERL